MKLLLISLLSAIDLPIVASRLLKGSTVVEINTAAHERGRLLQDTIQVATYFEYALYFNSDIYTASSADQTVQDSVSEAVQELIQGQHSVNVTLQSLNTTSSVECKESILAKYPSFDSCSLVSCELLFDIESTVNSDVVQRALIQGIHTFMDEFNVEHNDLHISLEYPIEAEATIEVEMIGVPGTMNSTSDIELFEDTFKISLTPIMLKHENPSFELSEARVLYQEPGVYEKNERVRILQTAGDRYNRATVFVRATCEGSDNCTDENLQQYLVQEGPQFNNDLELALKQAGRTNGSDYFSGLSAIYTGASYMNGTASGVPQDDVTTPSDGFGGETPWWIWLLLAINAVILVGCCSWVAIKRGQKPSNQKN